LLLGVVLVLAGCGSSSKSSNTTTSAKTASTPNTFTLRFIETGNATRLAARFTTPGTVSGGLVTVQVHNTAKAQHSVQLIRVIGGHTIPQALAALGSQSHKTPSWLRAEGGVGLLEPSETGSATMVLAPGKYAAVDVAAAMEGKGPPPVLPFTVTTGNYGALPATATTVTAANPSKDHYRWQVSGPLKTGANQITFVSKGKTALHELGAVRITGNESIPTLVKALESNGRPPSFVDFSTVRNTAVLDGGRSLTTTLTLSKPGTYIFFCHLTDRDGGKPHFAEGLITKVKVQ
jgi:hypothetical protein